MNEECNLHLGILALKPFPSLFKRRIQFCIYKCQMIEN